MVKRATKKKHSLLVVDDEPMVRRFIRFVVDKQLPELQVVGEAANGCEAVQKALELNPDIFLTDIRMPKMDGLAAAKEVRKSLSQTQVVFVSAYEEFDYAKEAITLKAEEYLIKPIRPQNLIEVLRRCVLKAQQQTMHTAMLTTMNARLKKSEGYLKAHLAEKLLQGNFDSEHHCMQLAALAGYEYLPDLVAIVEKDCLESDDVGYYKTREISIILEKLCCPGNIKPLVYQQKPGTFVCFLKTNADSGKSAVDRATKWASMVQAKVATAMAHQSITMGIGDWASDYTLLPTSYQSALTAKSFRFIWGPGRIFSLQDLNYEAKPNMLQLLPMQTTLVESVQLGNLKLAKEAVTNVLAELRKLAKKCPPKAKEMIADTAQLTVAAAREGALKKEQIANCLGPYKTRLRTAFCFDQMAEALIYLVTCLTRLVNKTQTNLSTDTIAKAINFIQNHYQSDLTLAEVAATVYLSPYYFSRLFKRTTGINFSQYLTKIRIDAAKDLLRKSNSSIKEIAQTVGYADPGYFGLVFKKVVGVPPGQYR